MLASILMTAATLAACTSLSVSPQGVTEWTDAPTRATSAAGYDAIKGKGRRQAPSSATMHEDRHLNSAQRRQAIGGVRDLRRNSSLVDWMIRRHLDYVASFRFQGASPDRTFNEELEAWLLEESRPNRFDVRGVLSLPRFVRLCEAMAVLDGDIGTVFIEANTGRLQGIEADRVCDPTRSWTGDWVNSKDEWYNGVRVDADTGRRIEYAVHRRRAGYSGLEYERSIPAGNFHLHGYLSRFDQVRGISPLMSAYNQLRDVYEAEEYALVRSKAASMMLMAVKRSLDSPLGEKLYELDENGEPIPSTYQVDAGRGPIFLDMDPGDEAQMLDSDNPGANLQEFWKFVSLLALKALDLPYGLFDESANNFFGNKTAWLGYDRACEDKRDNVRALLDRITTFKLRVAIKQKQISLPKTDGRQLTLADTPWRWVARKMPWWRPLEEVTAYLKAIEGGLTTPQRVCAEADQGDWYDNMDQIALAIEYARKKGVPLNWAVNSDLAASVAANRTA